MSALRAVRYFFQEALISLWRSRLMNALSIATIAISLFVLGAFLTVASNLSLVVSQWSRKVQVTFYLKDNLEERIRAGLAGRLKDDAAVEGVTYVDRQEALERFREMFRDLRTLPEDLGENPFPAFFEVTIRSGRAAETEVERLVEAYKDAPGVEEIQYDLLWIRRLSMAIRLMRWLGAFLGSLLLIAAIFTIANVIRLTVYARQDELDIMRLVGATSAYVKGPFVVEGMLQGGLSGLLAVACLYLAFRVLARDAPAGAELLGRAVVFLPAPVALAIIVGGMVVGIFGSLVSLRRTGT
ncbi:MAG: permease-like cell division protein FtsX [Vicinamibacteria bacterium]|jgi:cell division transport system permease protein|nr:permease-like cell division protein FtsX [Vicinamibacteria bacterium]